MSIGIDAVPTKAPKPRVAASKKNQPKHLRRHDVLAVLLDIAKDYCGSLPNVRGLWLMFQVRAKKRKFKRMALSTFRTHIRELIKDGSICRKDGVIYIPKSHWRPPRNLRHYVN